MLHILAIIYLVGAAITFVLLTASGRPSGKLIGAAIWPLIIPFLFERNR